MVAVPVPSPVLANCSWTRANHRNRGFAPVSIVDYQQPDVALSQRYGPMNMLAFTTQGSVSARLMIRPSGTEPKVKCYVSVTADPGTGIDNIRSILQQLRDEAATLVQVK